MKKILALLAVSLILFTSESVLATSTKELVVYTYPSFVSWGLANATIPLFEKEYGIKVKIITMSTGKMVNRLILEKDHPYADVVIGIDNGYASKLIETGVLEQYKPPNINVVPDWLIRTLDPTYHLIPFDYGAIAIDYNKTKIKTPSKTFEDLLNPRWRKSLILEDPRTSSTGMSFLLWTIGVFGDPGWLYYWQKLKPQIYAIVESWDAGWEMWSRGEAPLFVSYVTDPAYDAYYSKTHSTTIGVVLLNNTAYVQVEGVGIVKGCKHEALAKKFVQFVLSREFQEKVPVYNWMFPANSEVKLPKVYSYVPKWSKVVDPPSKKIYANQKRWLQEWVELMVQNKTPEQIIREYKNVYGTTTPPSPTPTSSKKKGICGPAALLLLSLLPLLRKRL